MMKIHTYETLKIIHLQFCTNKMIPCKFHGWFYHKIFNCDWIWKTDQIVTLGLFHLIGPANSYAMEGTTCNGRHEPKIDPSGRETSLKPGSMAGTS